MSEKPVYTIIFNGDIEEEPIKKLIKEIDENQDKKILLFFTTDGGCVSFGEILLAQLNTVVRNGAEIKLMPYWKMSSCGFDILMKFQGDIEILSDVHSVVHIMDWRNSYKSLEVRKDDESVGLNEQYKRHVKRYLDELRGWGLTDEEVEIVEKGDDLFLPYERLCELVRKRKSPETQKKFHPKKKLVDGADAFKEYSESTK
jgi:hypothetical protein